MSNSMSSPSYTIKLFENSTSEDFIEALNIYLDEMPSELRTASNEIIYWIDNYNKSFEDKTFNIWILWEWQNHRFFTMFIF